MFLKVHRVSYRVEDADQMAEYLEKTFGLTPYRTGDWPHAGHRWILYRIGPTILDFRQPTQDDTDLARELREQGPGVRLVAWTVEGIDGIFQDLRRKGVDIPGERPQDSGLGYKTINIKPSSSHGIRFQLVEGEMK